MLKPVFAGFWLFSYLEGFALRGGVIKEQWRVGRVRLIKKGEGHKEYCGSGWVKGQSQ